MYFKRLSLSSAFAIIIILIHQHIQGIPDVLQLITNSTAELLVNFNWYKHTYDRFLQLIIIVSLPIIITTIIGIGYKQIYKENFSYRIATAWLVWLFLTIPHVIV